MESEMKDYCFVVSTKPVKGQEEEYNSWYDTQHIPDVLAVPGLLSARRFAASVDGETRYLALYQLKTDNPDGVLAELTGRAGTDRMPMSPALDVASANAVLYEAIGPVQLAAG
jgi:hypothetical protein